jgi:hypothetical protein
MRHSFALIATAALCALVITQPGTTSASAQQSVMTLCKNKPSADVCQNQSPIVHGCTADAKRLAIKGIYRGRAQIGHVELLGSKACKTKWAKTVPYRAAGRNLKVSATILIGQDASAGVDITTRGTAVSNMVFQGDEDGVYSASGMIARRGGIAYGATTVDR